MAKRRQNRVAESSEAPMGTGEPDALEITDEAAEILQQLQEERDQAVEARMRALADFSNFRKRANESELRALQEGAARVARSLVPVLDNFDLALSDEAAQSTIEQLRLGVELVHQELLKALEGQGVRKIAPEKGDEFDPEQHEAIMQQESPEVPPNCVLALLQPGYAMGEIVLRAAKVSVAVGDELDITYDDLPPDA